MKKAGIKKSAVENVAPVVESAAAMPKWLAERSVGTDAGGVLEVGELDPKEEKMLDWILKGVVGFILGWLGLSILLVLGGLFNLWG